MAKPAGEFVIRVRDIDSEGKRFACPIRVDWLRGVLEGTDVSAHAAAGDGDLALEVHRAGSDIVVRGRASATLEVACSRCLERLPIAARAEILTVLRPRPAAHHQQDADEVELTAEELTREYYEGEQIVLDEVVRENLILELPMQPRCAEGTACATAWAAKAERADTATAEIDPRLAPLQALAGKLKPTSN